MSTTLNPTSQAHGLDGSLVEPDWPPLTLDEVRMLLRRYPGLGDDARLLTVSPRPFSAASVVETRSSRVFVKRHHRSVRTVEALAEEHRFMAHLHAHGAQVPEVLAAVDGTTAVASGEWTYEVHSLPPGIDLYGDAISWTPFRTTAHAHSAGCALAKLHLASSGYVAPRRRPRPLVAGFTVFAADDPGAAFDQYTATRPALLQYLSERDCREEALALLAPFHAELLPLLPELAPLWTHNDLHASNLFWTDSGQNAHACSVIDFGLCDRTNAVHDLAHAIERNIVEWLALVSDPSHPEAVPVHTDHLYALLDGYQSVRPLSHSERLALAPMAALCHAEFALSETEYFLHSLHSPEKAAMACEGYLVSHARWFHGAGRILLESIRNWTADTPRKAQ